jgi:hypothetical protein
MDKMKRKMGNWGAKHLVWMKKLMMKIYRKMKMIEKISNKNNLKMYLMRLENRMIIQ